HARERQHRVAPVGQPGRARVVALPAEVEPPPAVRDDRARYPDRLAQRPALLDVQLDEAADPAEQVLVRADRAGVEARVVQHLGERVPVAVGEGAGPRRGDRAGQQPRPAARPPEPGPPRPGPHRDPDRPRAPRSLSRSTAANADTTPSGPSNAPPPGTESRWLPVTTAPSAGKASRDPPSGSHQANMLPFASCSTSRSRRRASLRNQARHSSSGGVHANRW